MSDGFHIPDNILGRIDDELAIRIGRVAMLASIVETQLAGVASNLGEKTQLVQHRFHPEALGYAKRSSPLESLPEYRGHPNYPRSVAALVIV